ncbi:sulfurtransferase [Cohnella sp. WQ 127256]|uniref:sulfurtransferase n=1 Tax=Cohnella sp. WQ 127256 TaxID=2938790 RepID=UPI00211741FF
MAITHMDDVIVDVEWLFTNLLHPKVRIVDARKEGYADGHIPHAVHAKGYTYFTDPNEEIVGNTSSEDFREKAELLGINNDSIVVVYDSGNQYDAARLFYLLEYYGHENVKWLQGGFTSWVRSGKPLQTVEEHPTRGTFVTTINTNKIATKSYIQENLHRNDVVILDARSKEEYLGDTCYSKRGGRIPGSIHLEWSQVFSLDEVPLLRSKKEIFESLLVLGVDETKTIIPYCQQNIRGSVLYLALRSAGVFSIRPYEASWEEWGNDSSTPVDFG